MTRRFRQRGFTLIELMVVILLIGILSAAILPAMRGSFEEALLRSTGRELMNVFELAHSRAVTLNESQRVRIDEATGRYVIESPVVAPAAEASFAPVRDVPGAEGMLDSRITIAVHYGTSGEETESAEASGSVVGGAENAAAAFTFYPDGTADPGEIRLQDRDGFRLALRLNPVTARVRIEDIAHE